MAYENLTKEEAMRKFENALTTPGSSKPEPPQTMFPFEVPSFVTPELLEELANLPLEASDVFIITYPKAGTTWTQQIVKLIRNAGEKDGVELQRSIPYIDGNSDNPVTVRVDLSTLPKPRAFKSHMPYEFMPCGRPDTTPCKYIYTIRNPKDVAVSLYHQYCRLGLLYKKDAKLEWDLFFRNFIYGNLVYGDFFDHILSWWPHRNYENVLFLTFEERKKDLRNAVVRIAKFIEADVSDEVIDKVVAASSFDTMKKDKTANLSYLDRFLPPGETSGFLRKGEVGNWKSYFTPEQSAEVDELCRKRLEGTGLVFDFGNN